MILLVETPIQLFKGSSGTAEAIANPWSKLDFQWEPYVVAMKMSVPDSIYPWLSLLLHHSDCGVAVAIGWCHCPQSLFCMLDRFMVDGGIATAWKWDCNSKFSIWSIQHIPLVSIVPLKRNDWEKHFAGWRRPPVRMSRLPQLLTLCWMAWCTLSTISIFVRLMCSRSVLLTYRIAKRCCCRQVIW